MYPQKIKKIWWNEKVTISLLKFFERLKIFDSGSPHSTDVDNPEWNRKTAPTAEAS
jgi:hypothetical protein